MDFFRHLIHPPYRSQFSDDVLKYTVLRGEDILIRMTNGRDMTTEKYKNNFVEAMEINVNPGNSDNYP